MIQVYKATGDYEQAKKMYDHYSEVSDNSHPRFLSLRSIVLDRKQPRKMFVQGNTKLSGTCNTKPQLLISLNDIRYLNHDVVFLFFFS